MLNDVLKTLSDLNKFCWSENVLYYLRKIMLYEIITGFYADKN